MNWLASVRAIISAVGNVFGYLCQRSQVKNAPDVRAAEMAQDQIDEQNEIEKHVAQKDVGATREDLAE